MLNVSFRQKIKSFLHIKRTSGYGAFSAILVTLMIYFGSQFFAGMVIGFYMLFSGTNSEQISRLLEGSTTVQFLFILLVETITLSGLWLFIKRRKVQWSHFGVKRPMLKSFVYAVPAFFGYLGLLMVGFGFVSILFPGINFDQKQQIGFESSHGVALFLVFISLVILPAIVEEILVRGFLYTGLRQKFNRLASALLVSAIFGIAHLQLGSGEPPLYSAAIDTFILSIVLVWLREKSGSIWAGVLVHMSKNGLAFLSLFVFAGRF